MLLRGSMNPTPQSARRTAASAGGVVGLYRLAVRLDDVPDGLHHIPQGTIVEDTDRTGLQIQLPFFDRQDVLALRHAICRESKLTRQEWDAAGKLATDCETGRGARDDQGVMAAVETLPGNHDHGMRTGHWKAGDVDLAGFHQGFSVSRRAAFRSETALIPRCRLSSSTISRTAPYSLAGIRT